MTRFTLENTLSDINTAPELANYSQYLMYGNPDGAGGPPPGVDKQPLFSLSEAGWSPEGILVGINKLVELIDTDHVKQYFVYDEAEISAKQMKYVNLIHLMPEKLDASKPSVVLCAGGAYFAVCTMVESLPTARHFLEKGYQVFLLTYRVGEPCVTPRSIDDLARAIKYLCDHAAELNVDSERIVIGGYSAGANLISSFGTTNIGYRKYGLPKPLALLPVYTFIDLKAEAKRDENGGLLSHMFGPDYLSYLPEYNIADHVDADYPPCYITVGKNDTTVPCANSELLKELLDKAGVPAILDEGEDAPHGFGDGTGTDVEGWPERAMDFIENL